MGTFLINEGLGDEREVKANSWELLPPFVVFTGGDRGRVLALRANTVHTVEMTDTGDAPNGKAWY